MQIIKLSSSSTVTLKFTRGAANKVKDTWETKYIRLDNKKKKDIWKPPLKSCPVLSQCGHNRLVTYSTYLTHFLSPFLSPSLSYLNAFRGKIPLLILFSQSSHASMCWPALSAPPCARCPQLYPHEEYVITGESRPDRWLCVKPQCSPGRVILPRGHYQINSPLFLCVWASLKSPTSLLLPLSLYAFLPFLVFVFPSGLPDVPGYMPLSSWVQGTKPTSGKRWS